MYTLYFRMNLPQTFYHYLMIRAQMCVCIILCLKEHLIFLFPNTGYDICNI